MHNLDQKTYDEFIAEAQQLREHLQEWTEQFQNKDGEQISCYEALMHIQEVIPSLHEARAKNQEKFKRGVESALHNVETGMATRMDAITLRRALG